MENTKIQWADHTMNPWIGCTAVSPGCFFCYAEDLMADRFKVVVWGPHGVRKRTSPAKWNEPFKWAREPIDGRRPRVFCASLADVFDNQVPPFWRADLFDVIRATPQLDWMILTKRPQNIVKMLPPDWDSGWPQVWLGISAEDQEHYDQRWPVLAKIPAALRFVSYEPALGPLTVAHHEPKPDWLICGGESGREARPMDFMWAIDIVEECERFGIVPFMKQAGSNSGLIGVTGKGGDPSQWPIHLPRKWPTSKQIIAEQAA